MVARNNYYFYTWKSLCGTTYKVVIKGFSPHGRIGRIKHVASYNHSIGSIEANGINEPKQEVALLGFTVVTMENVAKMPVGGMEYFHKTVIVRYRCIGVLAVQKYKKKE